MKILMLFLSGDQGRALQRNIKYFKIPKIQKDIIYLDTDLEEQFCVGIGKTKILKIFHR